MITSTILALLLSSISLDSFPFVLAQINSRHMPHQAQHSINGVIIKSILPGGGPASPPTLLTTVSFIRETANPLEGLLNTSQV